MGSLLSKEFFGLSLCLITLFSMASCASSSARSIAEVSEVKRSPPGDARFTSKIVGQQFTSERN